MRWYAVMTKARKEELAQKNLKWQGYETFYPHYSQWTTPKKTKPRCVRKPYLTRYLFVGMNGNPKQSIYQINNTIGVATTVYCGPQALQIPVDIITELQARADDTGEVYIGEKKPKFPGKIGDLVKFREGCPLFGLIAELRSIDIGGKLMVKLDKMLGSEREILVNRSDVGEIIPYERDDLLTATLAYQAG